MLAGGLRWKCAWESVSKMVCINPYISRKLLQLRQEKVSDRILLEQMLYLLKRRVTVPDKALPPIN